MKVYNKSRRKFGKNSVKDFESGLLENYLLPQSFQVDRPVRYAFCMDLEATCENVPFRYSSHEVIEFGIALLDLDTGEIIDKFQSYVKPTLEQNQTLSQFCMSLCHITQEQVSSAPSFIEVLKLLNDWTTKHDDILEPSPSSMKYSLTVRLSEVENKEPDLPTWSEPRNFVWATHGLADFERFLCEKSCQYNDIQLPPYMIGPYIDIMQLFARQFNLSYRAKQTLPHMCDRIDIPFEGTQHTALADANCVASILKYLVSPRRGNGTDIRAFCNAFIDMDSPEYCEHFKTNKFYRDKIDRRQNFRYTPIDVYYQDYRDKVRRILYFANR